jgi:hypothetical protein
MAGVKLEQFKGIAPKIAPEHLAEGLGQIARNAKIDSGDLIPYPEPVIVGSSGRTGTTKVIYPLVNPDTDALVWLSWGTEVSVATPAFEPVVSEQRVYYTGDGVPKVTTYALATSGGPPYPYDYYELGLPLPETKVTTSAATFTAKGIISVSRDSGGIVTYVTSTGHNLRTGMVVSIKGFANYTATYSRTGNTNVVTLNNHGFAVGGTVFLTRTSGSMTDGSYTISAVTTNTFTYNEPESGSTSGNLKVDTRAYNTTGAEVIVVDDTTFKLFLPGFEQDTYTVSGPMVELAGQTYARNYVYTWYTPWGEESVASDPSEDLILKEGQIVTVTALPTAPPLVPTKNFVRGVRLYRTLAGVNETDFYLLNTLWFPQNTARVQRVADVVTVTMQEPHNFLVGDRFKLTGCTNSSVNITDGIVTDTADAYVFSYVSAGSAIADTADTTGVLYHDASENPDEDAARYWGDSTFDFTDDYSSKLLTDNLLSDEWIGPPEDLQGLTVVQNNILAGFVRNSLYLTEPDQPHAWPEAYIKVLDVDIIAIRALSGVGAVILTEKQPYVLTGSDPATMTLQKVDALYPCVSARGAVSMNFGVLFPTYEGMALVAPSGNTRLATANVYNGDTWTESYDPTTILGVYYDNSYFGSHSTGSFVYEYDERGGGSFVNCDTIFTAAYNDAANGAVYLASGTNGDIYRWDDSAQAPQTMEWKSKRMTTQAYNNIGAARILAAHTDTSNLTFTMWADGVQVYSNPVYNDEIFRLPRGFRTDTFEFAVEGDIRVRSIHLGQTPLSLKEV